METVIKFDVILILNLYVAKSYLKYNLLYNETCPQLLFPLILYKNRRTKNCIK